jgi:ABC-type multidrug transport system permease subunit
MSVATAHDLAASRTTSATRVAMAIAWRSLRAIPRVPATFIPSIVFPVLTVVAFSGAFDALVRIPGFPVPKMIDWMLPMSVVQGAAFAGMSAGFGVARDIEDRFFDRLLLAPIRHQALVAGPLLAAVVRSALPFAIVLAVGLAAGAQLPGGVAGVLTLFVASAGAALAAAGWSLGLAFRIPGQRSAPLMQVPVFFATFLSTAQVPLELMSGWLKTVARLNPMTYMLQMGRQGFIDQVTWAETWPGLVAITGLSLVTCIYAARGIRRLIP